MMRSIKSRGGLTRGRGITESVRIVWVSTLHQCAAIYQTMSALVNDVCISSEQHVELGRARIAKDFQHLTVILNWLWHSLIPSVLTMED